MTERRSGSMGAEAAASSNQETHYLEHEHYELVKDRKTWDFIRAGSLDGVWYWDLERPENEWLSPEIWHLLGYDPDHKDHSPAEWHRLIHPDDLQRAALNRDAHLDDPRVPYDEIVRFSHKDGSTIWVRCRGLAIRDAANRPIRMIGAYNDVTHLKRAEEKARREEQAATEANEDLKAFAYSASHDLKSPANTIRMLLAEARRALRDNDMTDADQLLAKAEETNDAMRAMVDKLLEYTRVIGAESAMGEVDLDALLSSVLEGLAADIAATEAQITVDSFGIVPGREWQLRQMFQNFISNAIKFQPPGQTPQIDIRSVGGPVGFLHLEIVDNGIGIAEEDSEKIFDLFTRLNRMSEYRGSGIGLAFCQRVIKSHGGRIDVRSDEDHGTTFRLSLQL